SVNAPTAHTDIYTLSLHDALPISKFQAAIVRAVRECPPGMVTIVTGPPGGGKTTTMIDLICEDIARDPNWREAYVHASKAKAARSEEHTSELQSQSNLVCRLLLEK